MKTIKLFAPVISALQRQQNNITRRLFAMGLALAGAGLLALPAAGQALPNDHTISFEADATWFFGFVEQNHSFGTCSGDSTLGSFTGTWTEQISAAIREGTVTLDFRHGSLTIAYQYKVEKGTPFTPGNLTFWTGTWVVSGGTGSLEGVTGEGIIGVVGCGCPSGPFLLSGTLSR